ncbi:hypothetical protein ACPZ19_42590 [Amycolatopsis lurida]
MYTPYYDPHQPTWLEIAGGLVLGPSPDPPRRGGGRPRTPWQAICDLVTPAVLAPPCYVSFTGGRDSSGLLAAATHVAREHGAPPPVAVTMRFPAVKSADEADWQELVIGHLGVRDWEKVTVDAEAGEMDLLGERSLGMLSRHGILWPFNVVLYSRVFDAVPDGGTVITGFGGDGLFERWSWAGLADVARGTRKPAGADLRPLGRLLTGRSTAKPATSGGIWSPHWLRPDARAEFTRVHSADQASAPRSWANWVRWFGRRRWVDVARWSLDRIADGRIGVLHPYFEPELHDALVRDGGVRGYGSRTAIMEAVFGDVLPERTVRRSTKAQTFAKIAWSVHSKRFLRDWDGSGLDDRVVDPAVLREEWAKPAPDGRSAMLLLALWLNRNREAAVRR